MKTVQIGKTQAGDGHRPYIVAEVGSNWSSLEDCRTSISLAKACGADAVKFQVFDDLSLYGMRRKANGPLEDTGWDDMGRVIVREFALEPHRLPLDWLPMLKEKADACGIAFLCTAFSPELYETVDPYVSAHKVASAECTHVRILETLRRLKKPVILSTGASGTADVRMALAVLQGRNRDVPDPDPLPVVALYCVAAYPARMVDLNQIPVMRELYNVPIGYSDHTTDVLEIPKRAVERGACLIEKHVNFVGSSGPDAPHSLSTDEFRAMVKSLRGDWPTRPGVSGAEQGMVSQHNRRLIATRDIPEGEEFKEGVNFGIYRSLKPEVKALSPFAIDEVKGKRAKVAIQAGDGIGPGDVG